MEHHRACARARISAYIIYLPKPYSDIYAEAAAYIGQLEVGERGDVDGHHVDDGLVVPRHS